MRNWTSVTQGVGPRDTAGMLIILKIISMFLLWLVSVLVLGMCMEGVGVVKHTRMRTGGSEHPAEDDPDLDEPE